VSHTTQKDPKGEITERFAHEATGFRWRSKRDQKPKVASRTPGTGKKWCNPSWFDKYCASRSRARRHENYNLFVRRAIVAHGGK
jgi:hypothetical protein